MLAFAATAIVILIYLAIKMFKPPTLYYAPKEPIDRLILRLVCPSCRSKALRKTGPYTITCDNCGFIFSVGVIKTRE